MGLQVRFFHSWAAPLQCMSHVTHINTIFTHKSCHRHAPWQKHYPAEMHNVMHSTPWVKVRDINRLYVWHDSLINVWHDLFICAWHKMHNDMHSTPWVKVCDINRLYVWHDSFIRVWLDSLICVRHDSFIYVWHDLFICAWHKMHNVMHFTPWVKVRDMIYS